MNNTTQFLIGFIGIIMIGYLFVAVFQCKSVNNFVDMKVVQPLVPESVVLAPENEYVVQSSENEGEVVLPPVSKYVPESVVLSSVNKSSSNNNLQGSPTDVKEDIMFSEKQVTSIFKTQFNYGNLIYFSN